MNGILLGLGQLVNPMALAALLGGVVIGLIVGSLPGLNDSITMAVLIPITFGMEPQVAICLLIGIYCASACGGSIPSILLKIPGTASATVTAYDGYPMSQKGKSGEALGFAISSSTFGGISSAIVLLFLSPFLAKQALKFGPPEYFMLAVLGMSTVIGMAGKNIVKNILAMALGLIFSCIGMSPQTGLARFTFGQVSLMDGISLIPMLIGLFGITAILEMIEAIQKNPSVKDFKEEVKENYKKVKVILPDKEMSKRLLPIWAQSSLIGNIIGIIPGAGMIMAIFMAYDQAARRRPNLEFGTGVPEGIAAPESANNAVVASSMVPLLALGVPGNSTSSLFLGALTIQGLRTGPTLFKDTPEMAYYEGKLNHLWVDLFIIDKLPAGKSAAAMTRFLHKAVYGLAMGHRYHLDFKKYSLPHKIFVGGLAVVGRLIPMRAIFAMQRAVALKDRHSKGSLRYYSNYQPDFLYVTVEKDWCDQVVDMDFEDTRLMAPAGWHEILTEVYGDYMTPPPKEQQVPTHSGREIEVFG